MIFYKDANGIWRSEKDLRNAYNICSRHINKPYSDFIRDFNNDPIFETRIFDHEPTVIEYLKMDRTIDAIYRYRELHKCGLRTAKDMVDKIREDMHKMEKFGTLKKPFKKRILTELESISAKRDLFETYYDMDIKIVDANGVTIESFDCHKGERNAEFFSYIIDGLNYKIEELKLELTRM